MMIELKSCQLSRNALKLKSWAYVFFLSFSKLTLEIKAKTSTQVLLRDPPRDCQSQALSLHSGLWFPPNKYLLIQRMIASYKGDSRHYT